MGISPLTIGGVDIAPGSHRIIDLPVAPLYTHGDLAMAVHVYRSRRSGPVLFVSAAIHGDELNGVEIIRRLLKHAALKSLRGTLLALPIVNVYGFINHSRYLPDGRDLNRSFPGSASGSLTGRLADTFMREIVKQSTHGIDLHTGARHRGNLPQIRADLNDPETMAMASAFGVPVILHSRLRDGSLRAAMTEQRRPMLLYEAGEALRFDETAIRAGVNGIINVMRAIGMLPPSRRRQTAPQPVMTDQTVWLRAPASGVMRSLVSLGARVARDDVLGVIADPMGTAEQAVLAPNDGIVIGRTYLPLVYEGDALFHIARYRRKTATVASQLEQFQERYDQEPMSSDDPLDAPIAN
ncbi:MAG TPA: succinylglutamate desuccinylase/aspartoacylase family protein [Spongiibacteraceae bacterium]|jgi:predicted deacylase|nr:succinylglutamate desuccinylase/aspartoacylase family protein [Spongiibacteraceae bacterium]HUH38611.1 succinylglutamate desuccinylase/aspartoacylase family protein [Spongiibacteraceae bacterium]